MSINNMKTLQQHISEKLVINKDFKKVNVWTCDPSKSSGKCIYLALPVKENPNNFIALSTYVDKYNSVTYQNTTKLYYHSTSDNRSFRIEKNEYDFYVLKEVSNQFWCYFVLFEKAAIEFLENLLNDVEQEININGYKDSKKNIKEGSYKCLDDKSFNKQVYHKKEKITRMLNNLKKKS